MKIALEIIVILIGVFFISNDVMARSWWGDGARSNEWVLTHGGTVIRYKIVASGASDRYKAIIYRDGKVVEWENGKTGLFDDPKDGTYIVQAYRGGISERKTDKGGKKILSSGPIVAHPGETILVTLNDLTNEVTVVSDRKVVKPRLKLPAPVPATSTSDAMEEQIVPDPVENPVENNLSIIPSDNKIFTPYCPQLLEGVINVSSYACGSVPESSS